MKWTSEQQSAIEAGGNLLVAAAAGSGKTAVLTERVLRLVREGARIQEFLVLTFTRAAAAEMKKRIGARLLGAAEEIEDDMPLAARLREAAAAVHGGSISTIDAFCSQILRRHFHEAGLDPAFRPADEAEAEILLEDAADGVIDRACELGEPSFRALADMLGGEEKLRDLLIALYNEMQSRPDPGDWLRRAVARYGARDLEDEAYVKDCLPRAKEELGRALRRYRQARDGLSGDYAKAAALADQEIMQLSAALLQKGFTAYGAALGSMAFVRLNGYFPRGTPEEDKAAYMAARGELKDCHARQLERFTLDLAQEAGRMNSLLPYMRCLAALVEETGAAYRALKDERGLVDYGDMEHLALKLLEDPRIAGEYRRRFRYIFVDEYQDSNRVQEEILLRIKREDNLFLVGDVKQSIYRFRRAEPGLFLEKYGTYQAGGPGMVIDLNANFRSAPAVIGAVNALFSRIMDGGAGEIRYDSRAALRLGREDGAQGGAELHLIERRGGDEDEGAAERDAAELEAVLAAKRIGEIMERERYTDPKTGESRPYRYSDFVLLHRSPKGVAERIVQLLSIAGIPAYAELTGGYFDAIEVQIFMNLLRVVDNRRQDIPLMSVLRSPIGGFSAEELARLRWAFPGENCLDSLLMARDKGEALGEKAALFLEKLDAYYRESRFLTVPELIGFLLDDTGFLDYVRALPGARAGNLEALVERAKAYGKSGVRSLSDFIRFMDRASNTDRLGAAQTAGADVVRLISIHKSKGLEFPVVLILGLDKAFNRRELREDLLPDDAYGLGLRYIEGARKRNTLLRDCIAEKKEREATAEEMRILYVGMTRAKERLILLIAAKDLPGRARAAAQHGDAPGEGARRPSDWILNSLLCECAGNPLRELAGLPGIPGEPGSPLGIWLHKTVESVEAGSIGREDYLSFARAAAAGDGGKYAGRFSYRYPYLADTSLPGKISVSELTGNHRNLRRYPDFVEKPLSPADMGTAAHACMQHIAIAPHTADSVRLELERLQDAGLLTREQAEGVQPEFVAAFFASGLGRRMCAAKRVERELMFNHRLSARRLMGRDTDEPVLLQGIIDCCFLEDNAWVLVDYKTDAVPPGRSPRQVAARHRGQLELYAEALQALTGIPVKARYIYLLKTGDVVEL